MHKKHQGGNNYKVKQKLSFLYVTYRHDLIYLTVKCHQIFQTVFKSLRMDRRRTDAKPIASSPTPFGRGIIKLINFFSEEG